MSKYKVCEVFMVAKSPPFKRLYSNYKVDGDCWIWQGNAYSNGYGCIKAFGKMVSCHRLSYSLYHGEIPTGMEVMHSCDKPLCINPDHLSIGTHKENMHDMITKGRKVTGKSNPVRGVDRWQSHQVMVLGKAYGSKKEAERSLGLGSGTVNYWVKNKPEKARIITTEEYIEATRNGN